MVKMESLNRPGQFKMFKESDVEDAKSYGWVEVGSKPKAKPKKTKKKK